MFGDSRLPVHFWTKVNPEPNTGCWLWGGEVDRHGYARFCVKHGKASKTAHRLLFKTLVAEVPADRQLDHLCRVRCCVNPAHLEPVTSRENTLRGEGPSATNARATTCHLGHPFVDGPSGRICRECTRRLQRAARKRWRDAGLCEMGPRHGTAIASGLCAACREKRLARARSVSASRWVKEKQKRAASIAPTGTEKP